MTTFLTLFIISATFVCFIVVGARGETSDETINDLAEADCHPFVPPVHSHHIVSETQHDPY